MFSQASVSHSVREEVSLVPGPFRGGGIQVDKYTQGGRYTRYLPPRTDI